MKFAPGWFELGIAEMSPTPLTVTIGPHAFPASWGRGGNGFAHAVAPFDSNKLLFPWAKNPNVHSKAAHSSTQHWSPFTMNPVPVQVYASRSYASPRRPRTKASVQRIAPTSHRMNRVAPPKSHPVLHLITERS